ncbi:MAG: DUF89 family protein [Anaerolineae bacterium]|nr:DUF89 family protein [Anaerolineae bacterium]
MKTAPECIVCFMKQALLASQHMTDSTEDKVNVLKRAAECIPAVDAEKSPPENVTPLIKAVRSYFGVDDPYREEKQRYNDLALSVYDTLVAYVQNSPDTLEAAARVAAMGNIMDLGIFAHVDVVEAVTQVQATTWAINHLDQLKQDLVFAQRILYLGDNAGEIVFDRLLVEALSPQSVTFAVKSGPVINDVTRTDARQSGMDQVATIIETGCDYLGAPFDLCSLEFRAAFESADVIIAKGMANFETLSDVDANIYFILKVKCPAVARETGIAEGSLVLMSQRELLAQRAAKNA